MENKIDIKIKILCYLIIAFFALQYLYFVAVTTHKGIHGDFYGDSQSIAQILDFKKGLSDEEMYKLLTRDVWMLYSLPYYSSLVPLFKLGYPIACRVWVLLNQLAFFFALYLLIKTIKPRLSLVEWTLVVFIIANFLPIRHNISGGQSNFLILLSLSGCLYFLKQKKDFLAGVFLAFGIIVKYVPILFLILLIWKKKYRCVLFSLLFIILAFLVTILHFGLKSHYLQLVKVIPPVLYELRGGIINHSVYAVFQRLCRFDLSDTQGIAHLPFLANFLSWSSVFAFLLFTLRKLFMRGREINEDFPFEFAFFVCLLLLVSNWIAIYHLVWTLIPFLIAFLNLEKIKPWIWLFMVSFILLGLEYWPDGLSIFRQGWGLIFLSGRPVGLVLLWIGYYLILSEKGLSYHGNRRTY